LAEAIILLSLAFLTHRTSYKDTFATTLVKTFEVFVMIVAFYFFHLV